MSGFLWLFVLGLMESVFVFILPALLTHKVGVYFRKVNNSSKQTFMGHALVFFSFAVTAFCIYFGARWIFSRYWVPVHELGEYWVFLGAYLGIAIVLMSFIWLFRWAWWIPLFRSASK